MIAFNGNLSNGELPFEAKQEFINVLAPIILGNTVEIQEEVSANLILNQLTKDVPANIGSQVPVSRFNVRFSEAGFTSDSYEFSKNTSHFDFAKEDFKLKAFSYTLEQMLHAHDVPEGLAEITKAEGDKMQAVQDFYTNKYLPSMRGIALITGSSANLSLPPVNVGGAYTDSVGVLNGEDMSDALMSTVADKEARYHLRGKAGATLSPKDIFTCSKMIQEYNTYSNTGVLALANSQTLYDLRNILGADESVDSTLPFDFPIKTIAGVNFAELGIIPDGKIIFIDAGVKDLILNAVSPTESHRGLAIINKGASSFNTLDEFDGTSIYVWKHGYHLFKRESAVWLDTSNTSAGDGIMHDDGKAELENWAKALRAGITGKEYVL